MIQHMLPYSTWAIRTAMEMDEDFISARRTIISQHLDWAEAVDCILEILFDNDVLGSPLTTFVQIIARNDETQLQFARQLRKAFFSLPSDVMAGS